MKLRNPAFTILMAVLLISCSQAPTLRTEELSPTAVETITPTYTPLPPTITKTAIPSPTMTHTPLPPSPTPTTTYVLPEVPEPKVNFQCLEPEPEFPPNAVVSGTLVLWEGFYDPQLLLDVETGDRTFIHADENLPIEIYGVSPDGKWLAYDKLVFDQPGPQGEVVSETLIISGSDGKPKYTIPWEEDWVFGFWLNNQHLAINLFGEPWRSVLVLNPFTGEREEYPPEYPDIRTLDVPIDWGLSAFTLAVFDRDLTRVVYPSWFEELQESSYVIWDLQSDQKVAELPFPEYYSYPPRWSPDGKNFIVANSPLENLTIDYNPNDPPPTDEFFLVSRDGEVTQLTNFAAAFDQSVTIYHYRWSPNGRYVAFWLDQNLRTNFYVPDGELAVLDLNTQEVTVYCVRGDFMTSPGEPPVWSPNSRQILVESIDEEGEDQVVLVDIVGEFAVEIIEGYIPLGWMITQP